MDIMKLDVFLFWSCCLLWTFLTSVLAECEQSGHIHPTSVNLLAAINTQTITARVWHMIMSLPFFLHTDTSLCFICLKNLIPEHGRLFRCYNLSFLFLNVTGGLYLVVNLVVFTFMEVSLEFRSSPGFSYFFQNMSFSFFFKDCPKLLTYWWCQSATSYGSLWVKSGPQIWLPSVFIPRLHGGLYVNIYGLSGIEFHMRPTNLEKNPLGTYISNWLIF